MYIHRLAVKTHKLNLLDPGAPLPAHGPKIRA